MKNLYETMLRLILLSALFFLCPSMVKAAGSATIGFSGDSTVYVGNNITITMYISDVNGANGGIASVGGNLSFDSSCLEYVSGVGVNYPYGFQMNPAADYKLAGLDTSLSNGITGYTNVFTFTFHAKRLCSTTITLKNAKISDTVDKATAHISAKAVQVVNPPSSNNNLSNLTISSGSLPFDKNNTSYQVNVDSDVNQVTVNAQAEDGGARVTGIGSKLLDYGNNTISITVTAPSGAKKTYTIHVNRKDNRSSNNKLASLTVNGGSLEPSFSASKEEYSLAVPYSVSSLDVNAKAEDSKAKVSITGQNDLVAEETRDVKIQVTAENGSVKTYTIHVSRGKDPNKVLSTNNYLASLTVSVGILSPQFEKEKENYIIYLPYEIDSIQIDAVVEDTKYGILKKEGPEKLSVGNNQYLLKVTAEDESIRTYKVMVVRAASIEDMNHSSNTYLKELTVKNGKLKEVFDKKLFLYHYKNTNNKKIKIRAVAEDSNSSVSVLEVDGIYVITVKSESGDKAVYVLQPEKRNNMILIWIGIVFGSSIIFFVIGYFIGKKHKEFTKDLESVNKTSKLDCKKKGNTKKERIR
ncbi:MAG: cadherin-like beta sandwich domain-containing protein [bacterium]|nr:cadherin-like beta sandwich domain-containing protein [bacterium]